VVEFRPNLHTTAVSGLNPPALRRTWTLEQRLTGAAFLTQTMAGNRKGQHSIRINDQWRICFRWRDGDAYDVEIVDYH